MSKDTKTYELLPDKKHMVRTGPRGAITKMKPGETCELTEKQARAFADKFRPAGKGFAGVQHPHVPEEIPSPATAPPVQVQPEPAAAEPPAAEEPEAIPTDGMTASDLIEMIAGADRAQTIAIHETESASRRPRKTVLAAAEDRLEEMAG